MAEDGYWDRTKKKVGPHVPNWLKRWWKWLTGAIAFFGVVPWLANNLYSARSHSVLGRIGMWWLGLRYIDKWVFVGMLVLMMLGVCLGIAIVNKVADRSVGKDSDLAQQIKVNRFLWSFVNQIDKLDLLPDSDEDLRRILRKLLEDANEIFSGRVTRAYILLPEGDYIAPFTWVNFPMDDANQRRFYVGDDTERKTGVAGACYKSGKSRVVRAILKDGKWSYDDEEFMKHRAETEQPPYLSFMCVPMIATGEGGEPTTVGVVCFDSGQVDTFDLEGVGSATKALGTVLARAVTVARALRQRSGSGAVLVAT